MSLQASRRSLRTTRVRGSRSRPRSRIDAARLQPWLTLAAGNGSGDGNEFELP